MEPLARPPGTGRSPGGAAGGGPLGHRQRGGIGDGAPRVAYLPGGAGAFAWQLFRGAGFQPNATYFAILHKLWGGQSCPPPPSGGVLRFLARIPPYGVHQLIRSSRNFGLINRMAWTRFQRVLCGRFSAFRPP
ncbi:hypothetical protein SBA4_1010006 [Candidatus Sulfopaludibacter sp. SbA4]|nr:hypothetical protein SBA4_1010006 [Candidatus Sulfopaludibacter sp. SbA4]